jgi:esterase FrsA
MNAFSLFRPLLPALLFASVAVAAIPTKTEEFTIDRPYGKLTVVIQTGEKLADDPLVLLNFSADRKSSLVEGRYGGIVRPFLEQGHRVVSFDLPSHGDRVDECGSSIAGLAASVDAGKKPFDVFVEDGKLVMDELIKRGLAKPGRIMVCGVSRAGYCALRLAAADDRIAAATALAPCTDWSVVREFAAIKDKPEVTALSLPNYADKLAGKRIYVAIGNADSRVGTDSCTRVILAVNEAERKRGLKTSGIRYHVADDSADHSLNTRWRQEGIQFLLRPTTSAPQQDLPQ